MTTTATKEGWRLLRSTLKAQRRGLTIGVLVGLVWTASKVVVPTLVEKAIDRSITTNEDPLWPWVVGILAAGVVAGIFMALRRYYAFRESRWSETWLRERLFAHIQQLHVGYHDHAQTGQLMSRASTDLLQVQMFVVMIPLTLSNFALLAAVVVVLVRLNPFLALLALGSVAVPQHDRPPLLDDDPPGRDGGAAGGRAGRHGGGGERRRRARREGVRRRARPGEEAADRSRRRSPCVARGGACAQRVRPADGHPAEHRPGAGAPRRRSRGHQRPDDRRRAHRLQLVRGPPHLAAACARHDRRFGSASCGCARTHR